MRREGKRVISTDEMTGIQATERQAPDLPIKPGKPVKREFEYIRHGTQTLIASFDVSSGKILHESIGQTRTELDFMAHVQQLFLVKPDRDLVQHSDAQIAKTKQLSKYRRFSC
jgi:putative transposase